MNNQIVWGLPHVFAVFLIVSASGALNVASMSSVFARLAYKPFARLSGALAVALLVGGLALLVLDLGRPGPGVRHPVPPLTSSRSSPGTSISTAASCRSFPAYLFSMMDRVVSRIVLVNSRPSAMRRFPGASILTTGTGSIFGLLVARASCVGRHHGAAVHRGLADLRPRLHRAGGDDHVLRRPAKPCSPTRWWASSGAC